MSIMNEAHSKMRKNGESDQSFKNRFTAERSIKEHQSMLGKLKSVVKALKEHDSTLFHSKGLILKQGEEFAHDSRRQCKADQVRRG